MKHFKALIIAIFGVIVTSCGTSSDSKNETKERAIHPAVKKIEEAHQKKAFLKHDAVQFDFQLFFGGNERMNGTLTLATNSTVTKIELSNGEKMYIDRDRVYCTDSLAQNPSKVRFDAYTWSYFFLFPFKLSDGGTQWTDVAVKSLSGKKYNRQKLTFTSGTGDSPDDWYIVYHDQKTSMIRYAAYIVTLNKSVSEAEKDPHAIEYFDYKKVDGVPLANSWNFWAWTEDEGLTKQLGEAKISNLKFVENFTSNFKVPEGLNEISLDGEIL